MLWAAMKVHSLEIGLVFPMAVWLVGLLAVVMAFEFVLWWERKLVDWKAVQKALKWAVR